MLSDHNAWIHLLATIVVVTGGVFFGLDRYEWMAVVFAIVAVWTAEALNTAFERLCDVASPDFHPLVEQAKDVAAGAVLIAAAGAAAVGGVVFLPHFLK
jgi:diacylglycerol kinase (ATP)